MSCQKANSSLGSLDCFADHTRIDKYIHVLGSHDTLWRLLQGPINVDKPGTTKLILSLDGLRLYTFENCQIIFSICLKKKFRIM